MVNNTCYIAHFLFITGAAGPSTGATAPAGAQGNEPTGSSADIPSGILTELIGVLLILSYASIIYGS